MADAPASGAGRGNSVEVQVLSAAPSFSVLYEGIAMEDYQLFEEFLNSEDIFFRLDEFPDGTSFFRIPQKIKNGNLIEIIVIFEEVNIKILIVKIGSVEMPEKQIAIYQLFNELNKIYKFFTFHLDSNNDVVFEGNLSTDLRDGDFQPEVLLTYIAAALKSLSEAYPQIMKVIWTDWQLNMRSWWNRQTRYFEGVVLVWAYEFKSHQPHQFKKFSSPLRRAFLVAISITLKIRKPPSGGNLLY